MFKITQNANLHFSLAEILIMAAMNQVEAKRKAATKESHPEMTR